MSQHDYIISNQGFPATRADINNVLNSIATLNSGTSAPATQYAGQMWIDTTTATGWILYIYDGADNIQIATINTSTNTVNFTDSALDVLTDTTPQLGGNLDVNGNSIVSTSNANITLAPDGTGDVVLSADTVKIGDSNANATITTDGTGDLILNTNSGSSSGSITIADGANANITIEPNGTGDILLNADTVRVGDSGANATITSNGAGDLILNTNSGTTSGSITIADGANGNITIAGNGTSQIVVNAGAVGTPTIAPTGDLNTGIFFPSADTIAFTEGGTEAMRINSSGNVKFNGDILLSNDTPVKNTPAFQAFLSSTVTPTSGVATKMTYQTEIYDTDNCYDNSVNYRFTPNVAGKYYVYAKSFLGGSGGNANGLHTYIYKNGAVNVYTRHIDVATSDINSFTGTTSSIMDMNGTTDYVEIFTQATGTGLSFYGDSGAWSNFGAFRIIGA